MIRFKSVSIKNFQSFGNIPTVISLDRSDITLILGRNLDIGTDGDSRNAAGKSVIFTAIYWCLFDCGIDDTVKLDGLVNFFNGKQTEVIVELDINGDDIRITRSRKPNKIELLKNNTPFTLHSTGNTNDAIVSLLRLDGQAFKNTYLLDANEKSYMALKPAEQRDFMERFLELDMLTVRAKTLKALRDEAEVSAKVEQTRLDGIRTHNQTMRTQADSLAAKASAWSDERAASLTAVKDYIVEAEKIDFAVEFKQHDEKDSLTKLLQSNRDVLTELRTQVNTLERKLQDISRERFNLESLKGQSTAWNHKKTADISTLTAERTSIDCESFTELLAMYAADKQNADGLRNIGHEISQAESAITPIQAGIRTAEHNLKQLEAHSCPYCEQQFHSAAATAKIATTKVDIQELNRKLATAEAILTQKLDAEETLKTAKAMSAAALVDMPSEVECWQRINRANTLDSLLAAKDIETNPYESQIVAKTKLLTTFENEIDLGSELSLKRLSVESAQTDIHALETKVNTYVLTRSRSDLIRLEANLQGLYHRKTELELPAVNPYQEQQTLLEDSIQIIDEIKLTALKKRQDHCQILVKLLTDSKSFIRKNIIDNYIPFLNGKLNDYLTKLGSQNSVRINPDLSVELYYLDHDTSYGLCSKGEKLRLNFSTSTALRDLAATFGKTSNLLLVDEYLDAGSDPEFFKRVFEELRGKKYTTFIISHRDELRQLADNTMTVTKQNGFSSVASS